MAGAARLGQLPPVLPDMPVGLFDVVQPKIAINLRSLAPASMHEAAVSFLKPCGTAPR